MSEKNYSRQNRGISRLNAGVFPFQVVGDTSVGDSIDSNNSRSVIYTIRWRGIDTSIRYSTREYIYSSNDNVISPSADELIQIQHPSVIVDYTLLDSAYSSVDGESIRSTIRAVNDAVKFASGKFIGICVVTEELASDYSAYACTSPQNTFQMN